LTPLAAKDAQAFFAALDGSAGIRSLLEVIVLQKMKLIKNIEASKLRWRDVLTLKTQFYDYSKKEWDVDFSKLRSDPSRLISQKTSDIESRFDFSDLLIITHI
jgi:hypothetical protein